jgi:hypothetical protein
LSSSTWTFFYFRHTLLILTPVAESWYFSGSESRLVDRKFWPRQNLVFRMQLRLQEAPFQGL